MSSAFVFMLQEIRKNLLPKQEAYVQKSIYKYSLWQTKVFTIYLLKLKQINVTLSHSYFFN